MSYRIVDQQPWRVGPWVCAQTGGEWTADDSTAIGLERNGELIAGTLYTDYNGRSVVMHTAIQRMNRDFLWYCFHYPFVELNVQKVLGLVDSFNTPAIALDRHLGFTLEAVIREAGMQGDLMIFSMTRGQCRWLNVARRPGVHHHGQQGQSPQNAGLRRTG
jgi:RimJ/RimL family protein N-acetyltransferase